MADAGGARPWSFREGGWPLSAEENKALVRRYFEEVFNQGHVDLMDELLAPDYVNHGSIPGHPVQDREGIKQVEMASRAALPDIRYSMHRLMAEGDMVAYHWTAEATHQGELMGIPATGRRIAAQGMVFSRIRDGKIAEQWRIVDVFGLLQQLGGNLRLDQGAAGTA